MNVITIDNDKLLTWLAERPEIAPRRLCKEAGIPTNAIYDLKNNKGLSDRHSHRLLQRLRLLGWKENGDVSRDNTGTK